MGEVPSPPFSSLICQGKPSHSRLTEGAEDGHKGLQLFDRVRPDLVLLDVTLPDQSGIEICQQMH
jgi:DNA-binding response OmpR family regulator